MSSHCYDSTGKEICSHPQSCSQPCLRPCPTVSNTSFVATTTSPLVIPTGTPVTFPLSPILLSEDGSIQLSGNSIQFKHPGRYYISTNGLIVGASGNTGSTFTYVATSGATVYPSISVFPGLSLGNQISLNMDAIVVVNTPNAFITISGIATGVPLSLMNGTVIVFRLN